MKLRLHRRDAETAKRDAERHPPLRGSQRSLRLRGESPSKTEKLFLGVALGPIEAFRLGGRRKRFRNEVFGDLNKDRHSKRVDSRDFPTDAIPCRQVERFRVIRRASNPDPRLMTFDHSAVARAQPRRPACLYEEHRNRSRELGY